jgi:hypothetical protein
VFSTLLSGSTPAASTSIHHEQVPPRLQQWKALSELQNSGLKRIREHAPWNDDDYCSSRAQSLSAGPSALMPRNRIAGILHPSIPRVSLLVGRIPSR